MNHKKLWREAVLDFAGITLKDIYNEDIEYVLSRSFKIEKKQEDIKIYKFIGYFWAEINEDEYQTIIENGWIMGTISLSLKKITNQLDEIETKTRSEVNTRKNNKYLVTLKRRRSELMNIYSSLLKQINKL
jgi:hypothetical protein